MKKIIAFVFLLSFVSCVKEKVNSNCEPIRDLGVEVINGKTTYFVYTCHARYEVSKEYLNNVKTGDVYCQ